MIGYDDSIGSLRRTFFKQVACVGFKSVGSGWIEKVEGGKRDGE